MTPFSNKPSSSGGNVERRIAGTAPSLGRVNRLTPGARSRQRKRVRKGERGEHEEPSRRAGRGRVETGVLGRWVALLLGVAGSVILVMVIGSLLDQRSSHEAATIAGTQRAAQSFGAEDAMALARRMLEHPDPETLAEILRPGRISAKEAAGVLAELENAGNLGKPVWLGRIDSMTVPIESLSVPTDGPYPRYVLMTPGDDGAWRIDFDAFVRRCDPPIGRILDPSLAEAVVRVLGAEDSYYHGRFLDEDEWHCFRLRHPDLERTLYGYCRRGTLQEQAMVEIQKQSRSWALDNATLGAVGFDEIANRMQSRVTLRLTRPEGASPNQFEIARVLADDWVLSDVALDERLAASGGS